MDMGYKGTSVSCDNNHVGDLLIMFRNDLLDAGKNKDTNLFPQLILIRTLVP